MVHKLCFHYFKFDSTVSFYFMGVRKTRAKAKLIRPIIFTLCKYFHMEKDPESIRVFFFQTKSDKIRSDGKGVFEKVGTNGSGS